jgi:hypothetical protein
MEKVHSQVFASREGHFGVLLNCPAGLSRDERGHERLLDAALLVHDHRGYRGELGRALERRR